MSRRFLSVVKNMIKKHMRSKKRKSKRHGKATGSKRHGKATGSKRHGKGAGSKKKSTLKKRKQKKQKTASSLSVFPDKSPQLQKKGEATKLTAFTTKNVAIRDDKGREYNNIINDRLAYRRAPRGQDVEDFSDILYGPNVVLLTNKNYNQLKKNNRVYYDRGSVVLRGPFIFEGQRRGPELLFNIKDTAYDKTYKFSISVSDLKNEKLYMVLDNKKQK